MLNICRFFPSSVMSLECGRRKSFPKFPIRCGDLDLSERDVVGGMSQNMLSESPCANCRSTAIIIIKTFFNLRRIEIKNNFLLPKGRQRS